MAGWALINGSRVREIKRLVIHSSDSEFGDESDVELWHRQKGWADTGYHYVILNGSRDKGGFAAKDDGVIEPGRPEHKIGAHVAGHNADTIGICLIDADRQFTAKQFVSLRKLVRDLMRKYSLSFNDVYCHNDFEPGKRCPGFDRETLHALLRDGA